MYASEIAAFLDIPLRGSDVALFTPCSLHSPLPNSILFAQKFSPETVAVLNESREVLVLAVPEYEGQLLISHVLTANPRMAFAKVMQQFFSRQRPRQVAPTAWVSPTAQIGDGVAIGHFSVIGDGVLIGDGTEIRDHVVIENAVIGQRCVIKSNTVIGQEGFGFEFEDDGTPVRLPHFGRVIIGNDVEIGALNTIARGTLDDTVLMDRVKIDDHVFVAHNVYVGENTVIIAGAEISGSVRIGKNVWIAPQATIINKVTIGDHALIGIGAVVTKSVAPNVVVAGNPARLIGDRS